MNVDAVNVETLRAYRRGDDRAAAAIYAKAAPSMRAAARAILRNDASADDVVQGVMCRLLTLNKTQIDNVNDVRSWLVRLARNEALTLLRANRRRDRHASVRASQQSRGDRAMNSTDSANEMTRIVDSLPRHLREVIYLKHVAGLTFDQLAVALDVNRSTLASRHRQGVELLRKRLSVQDPNHEVSHVA